LSGTGDQVSAAPAAALAACLAVLGRAGGHTGLSPADARWLEALMDSVHNLPYLIQHWDRCDEDVLRAMLKVLDDRADGRRLALLPIYDQARSVAG
jgi:hypothetical protein